eukprot:CAMPEP_0172765612 /NCGR_PEP_ID=MMETSP1074-20121228/179623_1 /TAXON_ID=2916 /ORGANISM="Ceratium fusus, Strain PA161109" /LENGTH=122 /DNA_ID=CAMNT_0013600589 /DNA_START=416 /DNA_END=784 /DNA_ORIENTATION=+
MADVREALWLPYIQLERTIKAPLARCSSDWMAATACEARDNVQQDTAESRTKTTKEQWSTRSLRSLQETPRCCQQQPCDTLRVALGKFDGHYAAHAKPKKTCIGNPQKVQEPLQLLNVGMVV